MKSINSRVALIILIYLCLQINTAYAIDSIFELNSNINKVKDELVKQEKNIDFYIFASFSLSDHLLEQMIAYAKIYNAQIVFRGLENNSFKLTAEHIQKIAKEDDEASIIIDPTLFTKFKINQVPSFILVKEEACADQMSCSNLHDKIVGNVTPKFVLEKFVEKGELSNEASRILWANR